MSSSLEGGRERDSGHIRFALTAITGNFAGSSVKGEIYTAGGSAGGRPCLPHPGEDEPKEKKGKLGSASHRRHVFTELGGRGAAGAGQPCIPAALPQLIPMKHLIHAALLPGQHEFTLWSPFCRERC